MYYLLEDDFTVLLVNAAHVKHVPGRKTDVDGAQWLRRLHEHGLLRASFRPKGEVAALRAYPRQRERLWGFLGPLDATVVFSTHELSEAEEFATRALVLHEGRLIHDGPAGAGLGRRFMEMVP